MTMNSFWYDFQEQLQKVKEDLHAEITRIQSLKNQEEDELQNLRQQKSEMEIYIHDLQIKRGRLEKDGQHSQPKAHDMRNGRGHMHLTDDQKKSGDFGFSDYDRRGSIDTLQTYDSVSQNTYHLSSHSSETTINNSYSYHPHVSQNHSTTQLSGPALHGDAVKEDNYVISLKRERSELESQICDMRIQLTRLQTEVTSLENRKTILETIHRSYSVEELRTGEVNGHGVGVDDAADFDTQRAITEVTTPFIFLSFVLF